MAHIKLNTIFMKKANWLLLTLGILLFSMGTSRAQLDTRHALGGRFGSATGFTYRYAFANDRAMEGILSIQSNSRKRRLRFVGLYQYHKPLSQNFKWFYGLGGSVGNVKYKDVITTKMEGNTLIERRIDGKSEMALSIDAIVGLEYAIPTAPLSISLDVKPYFDFLQESTIRLIDPLGFSIRYTF